MQISNSTAVNTTTYNSDKIDYDNNQGELSQTDFLNLFVTQLQNQDPTDPMDDSAMMEQTATFTQVELLTSIEENIETIAKGSSAVNAQELMMSASGYIGKLVEFEGNNTYLSDGAAAVSFETEEVPFKTIVSIKDADGKIIRTFQPSVTDTDMQTFYWNGTDQDGNTVQNGKYSFSVIAYDTEGAEIDVQTYGNGLVTGVKTVDGSLVYEVDGSDIPAEDITSVRDATLGGA
jgi:flagellar basal-body rod modification protein FlgD